MTVDRIDQWLAGRPPGLNGFWVKQRLRFNLEHGRSDALAKELVDKVRQNPQDVESRDMQQKLPTSEIPPRALQVLAKTTLP